MARPSPGCGGGSELSRGFLEALRQAGLGETLREAQAWAEAGFVATLGIAMGTVTALVEVPDGAFAHVDLKLKPLPEAEWRTLEKALGKRPDLAMALLAGGWPKGALEVIEQANVPFLPCRNRSIETRSFGSPDRRCLGAVCLAFAQRLDEDPLAFLVLSGRTPDRFKERLRAHTEMPRPQEDEAPDGYARFWSGLPSSRVPATGRVPEAGFRLPECQWQCGEMDLSKVIEDLMERLARKAEGVLTVSGNGNPSEFDPDERPAGL